MDVEKLVALENVRVIRDFLVVTGGAPNFTSLNFLRNLRTIKGQHPASASSYRCPFTQSVNHLLITEGPTGHLQCHTKT